MNTLFSFIKRAYPFLVIGTIGLFLGLSVYSSISTNKIATEAAGEIVNSDMVTAWDKRIRKVRQILPDHGIVGYLADWDIPNYTYGSSDQEVEFVLAQYTVAPVVLERGTEHSLILGNFNDDGNPNKIKNVEKLFGIRIITAFSNEIFLFEGKVK